MALKITVEGISDVVKHLERKKKEVTEEVSKSMVTVGAVMEGEIKASIAGQRAEPTSVDTGAFLRSVQFEANKDSVTIFSDTPYGPFLEFGTSKFTGRRHFNNSKDRNKQKVGEIIQDALSKV